jgi:lipopolysaccharide export LptBFGC system permease protein LptF
MKNFKYLFIITSVLCISNNLHSQSKKELKEMFIEAKEYSSENQGYIKFNYQDHKTQPTRYNIRFFDNAGGSEENTDAIEFWGHGKKRLTIFSSEKITIQDNQVKVFIDRMWNTYKEYQSQIRKNQIAYEHMDINLVDGKEIVFSCFLDNRETKYAFWIDKIKYQMDEKDFLEMVAEMKVYFGVKKK